MEFARENGRDEEYKWDVFSHNLGQITKAHLKTAGSYDIIGSNSTGTREGAEMANNNFHKGHRSRMHRRFLERGFDGYYPHEMVEQLLFEALPRRNTNEIAHALVNRFGSLTKALDAKREEFLEIHGIGEATADFLCSAFKDIKDLIHAELLEEEHWKMRLSVPEEYAFPYVRRDETGNSEEKSGNGK